MAERRTIQWTLVLWVGCCLLALDAVVVAVAAMGAPDAGGTVIKLGGVALLASGAVLAIIGRLASGLADELLSVAQAADASGNNPPPGIVDSDVREIAMVAQTSAKLKQELGNRLAALRTENAALIEERNRLIVILDAMPDSI